MSVCSAEARNYRIALSMWSGVETQAEFGPRRIQSTRELFWLILTIRFNEGSLSFLRYYWLTRKLFATRAGLVLDAPDDATSPRNR